MSDVEADAAHVRAVTEKLGGNKVWCIDEENNGNNIDTQIFWSEESARKFLAAEVYYRTRSWKAERREAVAHELKQEPDRWHDGEGGMEFYLYERTIRP